MTSGENPRLPTVQEDPLDPQPSPNPVNSFSDLDTNDSHIVQDTLLNADWSGGALTPAQENALDLFVIDNDGNWSFNGDLDLDFLAVGESITLTYEITVSDGNGLPATQNPLTVTLTGTNDQPVIDVGALADLRQMKTLRFRSSKLIYSKELVTPTKMIN